jgi:hypothetical protein
VSEPVATEQACGICQQAGHVRWTTFSATPDTVALLGLPKPKEAVVLRVCHGCYLRAVSALLARFGLPSVIPASQLPLPLDAPTPTVKAQS